MPRKKSANMKEEKQTFALELKKHTKPSRKYLKTPFLTSLICMK